MVLPGGGDLCLRVWSGFRRYVAALTGWFRNGSTHTTTFRYHIGLLDDFLDNETQHSQHALNMLGAKQSLRVHCEILFFLEIFQPLAQRTSTKFVIRNNSDLVKLLEATVEQSRDRGFEKLNEQKAKFLAISL